MKLSEKSRKLFKSGVTWSGISAIEEAAKFQEQRFFNIQNEEMHCRLISQGLYNTVPELEWCTIIIVSLVEAGSPN